MSLAQAYYLLAAILAVPAALLFAPDAGHGILKAFPRSKAAAFVLFGGAAAWFLYGISQMGEADLAGIPRGVMLGVFGAAAVAAFWLLPDLLPVRGLAGLLLLVSRHLLDAGFGKLPYSLLLAAIVYGLLILPAIAYGTAPYLLRDWIGSVTRTPGRARMVGGFLAALVVACLAFGATR